MSVTEILNTVCNYYLVSPAMAVSKRRDDKYVKVRQMVCLLSDEHPEITAGVLKISRCNVYAGRIAMLNRFTTNKKTESDYHKLKTIIMKAKGKMSVRAAVEDLYPVMPIRFSAIHFHRLIGRKIGRPDVFPDTVLRKMRELKEEGKINFKNIDKARSIYLKLTV